MELLTPSPLLGLWTFLTLVAIISAIVAVISLVKEESDGRSIKLFWLLVILFVPLIGSFLYFLYGKGNLAKGSRNN